MSLQTATMGSAVGIQESGLLDKIIEGDLEDLVSALRTHRQAELLKQGAAEGAAS